MIEPSVPLTKEEIDKIKAEDQVAKRKEEQKRILKISALVIANIIGIYASFKVKSKSLKVLLIIISILLTGFLFLLYKFRNFKLD